MPKTDPITGCPVMTSAEFWNAEAEAEGVGRSGADVMASYLGEVDHELRAEEDSYRNDPARCLEVLTQAVQDWNDADPDADKIPLPARVTRVLDVRVSYGRVSRMTLKAEVDTPEGSGVLTFQSENTAGSRIEPPEYDEDVEWLPGGPGDNERTIE